MSHQGLPPRLLPVADRIRAALGRGRFRQVPSWRVAVDKTPGYGAFVPPRPKLPWQIEPAFRTRSDLELVAAFGVCLEDRGSAVHVCDVGGGFGRHFGAVSPVFPRVKWEWTIQETPQLVKAASMFHDVPSSIAWVSDPVRNQRFTVGLLSSSLQYLEDPAEVLRRMLTTCSAVVLNRTPLWPLKEDRPSMQFVDGEPAYPAWFLSRKRFDDEVDRYGKLIMEWRCHDEAFFAGHRLFYSGAVIRTNA